MKIHKVSGSIIGVTANKVTTFISPELAGLDAATRKVWLFGEEGATRGSFTIERLYSGGDDEDHLTLIPLTRPLTFTWTAEISRGARSGKRRAYAVKQHDLGLNTMADPASLLEDLAFEVFMLYLMSLNPTYTRNPATVGLAIQLRKLVGAPTKMENTCTRN